MSLSSFRNLAKKIVCVGRNYKDHALELGNPIPKKPMLFVKTTNSLIGEGEKIRIPPGCENLHQEVELAVVISKRAQNVSKADAMSFVGGYAVALDMTARDFQIPDPHNEELYCKINGVDKQRCRTDVMIFDIPTLIEYATKFVTLEEGDLLLTGTPAGVCRVLPGDTIEFGLTGKVSATFSVQ